jgi:hypothetical protein
METMKLYLKTVKMSEYVAENYVHKHIIKEHKLIASLAMFILLYLWLI